MAKLQELLETKAKADALYAADVSAVPLKQIPVYLRITENIHVIEDIKFLLSTAPESMNPERYREHIKYALGYARGMCFNEHLRNFYLSREEGFKNFCPKKVTDYKLAMSDFMFSLLEEWNKEKSQKK